MRVVVTYITVLVLFHINGDSLGNDLCGYSSRTEILPRIIGGEIVSSNVWTWAVGLYHSNKYFCAGSLISSDLILTAAHCLMSEALRLSKVTIISGSTRLLNSDNQGQVRRIYEVFIHPDFNSTLYLNDIALIRLLKPFDMTNLATICLPNARSTKSLTQREYPVPGTSLVVIGWGMTQNGNMKSSEYLRQVTVEAVASQSSDCISGKNEMINSTLHFCAGVSGGGKDACSGDSGGPIMAFVNDRWQLVGITSNGYGCALPGHSGIYTRVAYYIPFIQIIQNKSQKIYSSIRADLHNNSTRLLMTINEQIYLIILIFCLRKIFLLINKY